MPEDKSPRASKSNEEKSPRGGKTPPAPTKPTSTLLLVVLFIGWYATNAAYNVYNAYMKDDLPFPFFASTVQLAGGLVYAIPMWVLGLREVPRLTLSDIARLLPIAALHALGHYSGVAATFQKGGGSFTHVIKASEPVVSAFLGIFLLGSIPKLFTALSLLPITYGVAYASTLGNLNVASMSAELTTLTAKLAMTSNVSFSLRSIVRKNLSSEFKNRTRLTPANDHAITTILSMILLTPFIFYYESIEDIQNTIFSLPEARLQTFYFNIFIAGLTLYLYNEMQNMVLGSLGPVPTAVGNTLKRVVIFVALYYFTKGETFPLPKVVGCGIAIAGCLAYAIFDSFKL